MNKAKTIKHIFSRETSIEIDIKADAKTIWRIVTDASNYPKWNSTILSMEGTIAKGEKVTLTSYLDPKRAFKLVVTEFVPERRLVWGDAMGKRVIALKPDIDGLTTFSMTEKIGGPLFPLFARMIPSFDESFERFAYDLKKEAEKKEVVCAK